MLITVRVDSSEWNAAMDELLAASYAEAAAASYEGATVIKQTARELLTALDHKFQTRTPSAPGSPPARISGMLAASVTATAMGGTTAWVGPTSSASSARGPYGRIQELSGSMRGHEWMHWITDGKHYFRRNVELPERPYLKPATRKVIDSGELHDIYETHQLAAILEVTG